MNLSQQYFFDAKINQKKVFESGAVELELELELTEPFNFIAGQYIWLELLEMILPDPKGSRRAFSIINLPSDQNKILKILFRQSQSGFKQNLLNLELGAKVRVRGPFGSAFNSKNVQNQSVTMVAGGVGVAPFLAILAELSLRPPATNWTLVFCNHDQEKLPYLDWLRQLAQNHNWFKLVNLNHRLAWSDLPAAAIEAENWWISGKKEFVNVAYAALNSHQVIDQKIVFEQNYPAKNDNLQAEDLARTIASQDILAHAIQDSTNHMIITDKNAVILFANKAAQKMTGFSFEEMQNNTPRLWGGLMDSSFYRNLWLNLKSGTPHRGEIINQRKNGEIYYTKATISPIFNNDHQVIGYIGTEDDITENKLHQEKIETIYRRLNLATKSAKIGIWEWDFKKNFVYWDDQMYRLFGLKKINFDNALLAWQNGVHFDDKKMIEEAFQKAILDKNELSFSFKVVWPNNVIHFLKTFGVLEPTGTAGEIKFTGISFDVTHEMEVDRAKTEFVSLASHQLRTPLTAINWYTEMLLDQQVGPLNSDQMKYLDEIHAGSVKMVGLVSNLLNVSRIEMGSFISEPQLLDLVKISVAEIDQLKVLSNQKKIQIIQTESNLPEILVDPRLMGMIYQNLLTNALKYTPVGGSIRVSHYLIKNENIGDCLRLEIADTGIGIPINEQAKIFTKLFRGNNAQAADANGNGLGLYIVKAIVSATGGEISFTSKINEGTIFRIDFPLSKIIPKNDIGLLE